MHSETSLANHRKHDSAQFSAYPSTAVSWGFHWPKLYISSFCVFQSKKIFFHRVYNYRFPKVEIFTIMQTAQYVDT